ncbi:hypothetical protein VZT92_007666 [Zoarces viviparus]|uniref:Uncharacterized protein n=1 Tax=Zoarces viviparus TaxID=48416 RepID=A0AAW1FKX7_ZOAVI
MSVGISSAAGVQLRVQRNPFEHSVGVDSLKHSFVQPVSEQALLQATLHEAKLELKADIQKLSGRLSVLESQVSEILRLLSMRRRLSLPPTSSPKARVKYQDSFAASKPVTPKGRRWAFFTFTDFKNP